MNRNKSRKNGKHYASYNSSMMGALAYHVVYEKPQKTTDAEFVSVADKKKKAPIKWGNSPFRTTFELEVYLRAARLVAEHYLAAVGRFYNAAIVLSNYAFIRQYKTGKPASAALQTAIAVVWRLMYEGLGLAGWTPSARLFLGILIATSFGMAYDKKDPKFTYIKDGDWEDAAGYPEWWVEGCKPSACRKETPEKLRISGIPYLCELAKIAHLKEGKAAMRYIIWATRVSLNWGAIEKGRDSVQFLSEEEYNDALLYGAIRRAGQGNDWAGLEQLSAESDAYEGEEEDSIRPQSCLRGILDAESGELHEWVKTKLGYHPHLVETMTMASQAHSAIEDFLFESMYGGDID